MIQPADTTVIHLSTVHHTHDNRVFNKEARAMVEAGYDFHLVIRADRDGVDDGVPIIALHPGGRLRRLVCGQREAWSVLERLHPDVLQIHDPELIPMALVFKTRSGCAVIYDAHEDLVGQIDTKPYLNRLTRPVARGVARALTGLADRHADAIVAATGTIADAYTHARTVQVRNYPWQRNFTVDPQPVPGRLVYVGDLTEERKLSFMIEVTRRLHVDDPRVHLHLAGRAPQRACRAAVEHAVGEGIVTYHGMVGPTEVPQIISSAQIGLVMLEPLPNYTRSLPTKLFEYMASGVPFCASNFDAWQQMFGGWGAGVFVDTESLDATCAGLAPLLADPQRCARMGQAGAQAIVDQLNFESQARTLETLVADLTESTRRRRGKGCVHPDAVRRTAPNESREECGGSARRKGTSMTTDRKVTVVNQFAVPQGVVGPTRNADIFSRVASWTPHFIGANFAHHAKQRLHTDDPRFTLVWVPEYHNNGVKRLVGWLFFTAEAAAVASVRKADLVYTSSPHLLNPVAGMIAARLRGRPYVAEVRDLWPDSLVSTGGLREGSAIHKMLIELEKFIYTQAERVVTVVDWSDHFRNLGIDPEGLMVVIPNGTQLSDFEVDEDREKLREEFDIHGVTAVFAGSHGVKDGVEHIVNAAERCPEVNFLLVGEGGDKDRCVELARSKGISNIEFRDPIAKTEVPRLLKACDIGLHVVAPIPVFDKGMSPTKLFDYMAAGLPVVTNARTPLAKVIGDDEIGAVTDPDDIASGVRAVLDADEATRGRWAAREAELLNTRYSREAAARTMEQLLDEVMEQWESGRSRTRAGRVHHAVHESVRAAGRTAVSLAGGAGRLVSQAVGTVSDKLARG